MIEEIDKIESQLAKDASFIEEASNLYHEKSTLSDLITKIK